MKPSVAITLIITGAVVVLAPIASDYLYQGRLVEFTTASQGKLGSSMLDASRIGPIYAFGCYALGLLMIAVGVLGSNARRPGSDGE